MQQADGRLAYSHMLDLEKARESMKQSVTKEWEQWGRLVRRLEVAGKVQATWCRSFGQCTAAIGGWGSGQESTPCRIVGYVTKASARSTPGNGNLSWGSR